VPSRNSVRQQAASSKPGMQSTRRSTMREETRGFRSAPALYGFTRSSGEIQRLPLASSGRSLCLVSNAAFGTGRCRQTSGLYRHQTHLASPLASHLGDGTTQLRNWSTSPGRSRIFLLGAAGEQEENGLGASASGPARTLTQNVLLGSRVVSQKVNFLGQGNKGGSSRLPLGEERANILLLACCYQEGWPYHTRLCGYVYVILKKPNDFM
jgi:hypothetical protein